LNVTPTGYELTDGFCKLKTLKEIKVFIGMSFSTNILIVVGIEGERLMSPG
jgi:hypothetical protein